MNLFGVGCGDDDPTDEAKGGAGQGGSGKTDGGRAPGGSGGAGSPATVGGAGIGGEGGSAGSPLGGGGSGGEGGSLGFDPICNCTVDPVDGFVDCTMPLAQLVARLGTPTSCENDLDYVYVETCGDGATHTKWLEGTENDYVVVRDSEGRAVYAHASGYVGHVCDTGVGVGRVLAGTEPDLAGCDRCVVCESHAANQGGAGGSSPACSP